ncbi:MAG: AraC family transcriptional regulator [Albidovulum sp.]
MPIASWSPGDVEAITVGIFPDAWVLLQGAPDFSSPPDIIFRAMTALRDKRTADEGWTAFCALLEPIWRKHQDESWKPARHLSDWARSVMVRAARSSRGESLRTFERHLKRLSGQTKRTLDFYTTFEGLHRIATTEANGTPADIAAMAGYSDQSHMGRSVRRATGFSPAALNHAIQTEEAFWCYRLLGQRF